MEPYTHKNQIKESDMLRLNRSKRLAKISRDFRLQNAGIARDADSEKPTWTELKVKLKKEAERRAERIERKHQRMIA